MNWASRTIPFLMNRTGSTIYFNGQFIGNVNLKRPVHVEELLDPFSSLRTELREKFSSLEKNFWPVISLIWTEFATWAGEPLLILLHRYLHIGILSNFSSSLNHFRIIDFERKTILLILTVCPTSKREWSLDYDYPSVGIL
jgi:hypothetical protein